MGNEKDILLNHIVSQIDKLNEKQDEIAKDNTVAHNEMHRSLMEYNNLLAEHIRRTELLEKRADVIESEIAPIVTQFESERVVKRFFTSKFVKISKVIGIIGATTGMIWGVIQILSYFNLL